MWRNYVIASFRFLKRYKNYTLLNLLGLSIGIASSIFIFLWVMDELSYEKHHTNYKNIYRLLQDISTEKSILKLGSTPAPYSLTLANILPEIRDFFRIFPSTSDALFEYDEKKFYEKKLLYADSSILSILSFDFIYGDHHALDELNNLLITESTAKRYFGDENPLGEIITRNNSTPFKITAVIKDIPHNSHIQFDLLLSLEQVFKYSDPRSTGWNSHAFYSYFLLEDNVNYQTINKKLNESLSQWVSMNFGQDAKSSGFQGLYLQPLEKIHLHSDLIHELDPRSRPQQIQYIYFFLLIGFVILLITSINYTNLAIACYARRTIEVGIDDFGLLARFYGISLVAIRIG
jgi:putative ABC transport system permease protein